MLFPLPQHARHPEGGRARLKLGVHAKKIVGCCEDDIAADECSGRTSKGSTDGRADDSYCGAGIPWGVFLFWYISFLIFGVVGERGVPKRAERDLGIEIPGFERGG
jgi:hypothetical protein